MSLGASQACQAQVAQTKKEQRQIQRQVKHEARRGKFVQELPPVIRRAIGATATLRLSGDRYVDQRVKGEMVRHAEHVVRDGIHIAITFAGGSKFAGQKIIDDGTMRMHYFAGGRLLQQPSQHDDTLNRFVGPQNQLRFPRFEVIEGPMIAGFRTQQVNVFGKGGVVVQQLDIEPNSGAVLKRVGYEANGTVVANFEYSSVNFTPSINASTWSTPPVRTVVTPDRQLMNQARKAGVPALGLPSNSGFQLESTRVSNRPNGSTMLHSVYQGPRGKLSLFVIAANVNLSEFTRARPNALNQVYATKRNGATVVLIGPYDSGTLQRLASSLQSP
jgi:hypothetical protein